MTATTREAYYHAIRPVAFKNVSGETIPPFAIMRQVSSETRSGQLVITVGKPNTTFLRQYLVNGPVAVADQKYGTGNDGRYVDVDVTYALGASSYGASPGSWKAVANRPGFKLLELLSADGRARSIHEPPYVIKVKTTQAIAFGGSGPATVYVDSSTAGPWNDITVHHSWVNSGTIPVDTELFAAWQEEEQLWRLLPLSSVTGGNDEGALVRIKAITGTPANCDDVSRHATCVWGGVVVSLAGSPDPCGTMWSEGTSVWVADATNCNPDTSLKFNEVYLARRVSSSFTPSGLSARPLYIIRHQGATVDCQAFADLDPAANPFSEDIRIPVLVDTYASPGDPEPESTVCKTVDVCDLRPRRVVVIEASGIAHGATGTVELANDSSVTFEVLNSDCGFLIPGMKVLAVPACGASSWIVAPMPIEYLGVTNVNIDADASGAVTIHDKTGTATAFSVTAFNRFTHGGYDIVSGEKVRVKWMFANAEFVIDVVECLVE